MVIQQVKSRSILFTQDTTAWNVNFQLILGERYNFVVDTGLGSESMAPIWERIADDPKPLIVINTHHDWDHIWGNGALPAAAIVSHALCRTILQETWDKVWEENQQHALGTVTKSLPTMVFEKELYFPDDGVRLYHTPGHTADSICVLDEKDGVLNVGDNIGMTQKDIVPYLHCGKDIYRQSLALFQSLPFDTCLSGHNTVQGKEIFQEIGRRLYTV